MTHRSHSPRRRLFRGVGVTSLGTLASRMLGLVRDMATASLLGLSSGGVMDAFVLAFRIPNLFRRLFGEGALTASYVPVLSARLLGPRPRAWQLVSVSLAWLALLLAVLVVAGEALCGALAWWYAERPDVLLVTGLSAVMLPYMLLICLTAHLAGTLQALGHFGIPALTPVLMNVCWLAAVWGVAPWFSSNEAAQAYVIAVAIVISGVLQVGVQHAALRRLGFRFDFDWTAARDDVRQVATNMAPMMLGLAVTQVNTLLDSLLAWGLTRPPHSAGALSTWGTIEVPYPLEAGATAAIYYGERMYQFPQAMLGIAVATVIFPLLSRHAARNQLARLSDDLALGLRLVLLLALPAAAGLVLLAEPLARLLFERGEFTSEDARRTAAMIAGYGVGVWAYCATPVIVRGYYALGERLLPVRVGAAVVGLNFALNLALVWPLAELGLALATAAAAGVETIVLAALFSRRVGSLGWRSLASSLARTAAATAVMSLCVWQWLLLVPHRPPVAWQLLRVGGATGVALLVFFSAAMLLRQPELAMLVARRSADPDHREDAGSHGP